MHDKIYAEEHHEKINASLVWYLVMLRHDMDRCIRLIHYSSPLTSRSVSFSTTDESGEGTRDALRDLRMGMGVEFPLLNFRCFFSVAVFRFSRGVEGGRCCCCCSPGLGVKDLRREEELSALFRRSGVVKKVDFEGTGSALRFADNGERFGRG